MVEADAIKNKDVVYQQLNRRLSRMGRSIDERLLLQVSNVQRCYQHQGGWRACY